MARVASIGEMRTRVVVRTIQTDTDADGFTVRKYQDIFPEPIWCKCLDDPQQYSSRHLFNASYNH